MYVQKFSFISLLRRQRWQVAKLRIGAISPILSRLIPRTNFAVSFAISGLKSMPFRTMSLGRIYSRSADASQNIDFRGNSFNMHWINAMSNSTKVVAVKASRNYFDKHLVNQFVGDNWAVAPTRLSVSVLFANAGLPFPTRDTFVKVLSRNFYLGKDSGEKFSAYRDSGRIIVRHIASKIGNLFRLVQASLASVRAVFIVPNGGAYVVN